MITRSNALLILVIAVIAQGVWAVKPPEHRCPGSHPAMTNITITYTPGGINVSPPMANAEKGGVLRFNLFGTFGTDVTVKGKPETSPDPSWIDKSGSNLRFYVCVPDNVKKGDKYKYGITADGSPPLDPVVRIL